MKWLLKFYKKKIDQIYKPKRIKKITFHVKIIHKPISFTFAVRNIKYFCIFCLQFGGEILPLYRSYPRLCFPQGSKVCIPYPTPIKRKKERFLAPCLELLYHFAIFVTAFWREWSDCQILHFWIRPLKILLLYMRREIEKCHSTIFLILHDYFSKFFFCKCYSLLLFMYSRISFSPYFILFARMASSIIKQILLLQYDIYNLNEVYV